MIKIIQYIDQEFCRELWNKFWPQKCFFDLWNVRACFAKHYDHPHEFITAEVNGDIAGMLPLSWIEEKGRYSFYPGELWKGKSWLEQNKIFAANPIVLRALLNSIAKPFHLRYVSQESLSGLEPDVTTISCTIDEIGFLFYPPHYNYSFDNYWHEFSKPSRNRIDREVDTLKTHGLRYRYDHRPDLDSIFSMNLLSFKENSYFYDNRFLQSFEALADWLASQNMLHIVTILLGDIVAAVDLAAIWNTEYVVLAGATNPEFPGVAKLINLHHIESACRLKYSIVDFLCGDFGWKERFHLAPRLLYLIENLSNQDKK